MTWIFWLLGVVIVLSLLGSIGDTKSSRSNRGRRGGSRKRGTKKIASSDDAFALIRRLDPTPWSKAEDMTPEKRARCFFMPDIEDVELLGMAKKYMFDFSLQDISERRCEFGLKIGTHEYADSFNESAEFYTWLVGCIYHKLQEGSQYRSSDFDLYSKRFKKSFCSPAIMIKVHDLYMPESLRLN